MAAESSRMYTFATEELLKWLYESISCIIMFEPYFLGRCCSLFFMNKDSVVPVPHALFSLLYLLFVLLTCNPLLQ